MQKLIEQLEGQVAQIKADTTKFEDGNNAAATRARVGSMSAIKTLKELRTSIQAAR